MAAIPPMRMKSTFASTSGEMTCARSTAIAFLSQLFACSSQLFNHLQHAQMLSSALLKSQLEIFAQQTAINIAYVIAHRVGVRSNCLHQSEHNTTSGAYPRA